MPKRFLEAPFLIYLAGALVALTVWNFVHARYQDDAYITLVYARNLLAGNGLTWNPGEIVEGYSNFLFLILIAGLGWLGTDLMLASKVISFAGYFGLIAALVLYTRWRYRRRFAAAAQSHSHSINAALCVMLTASSAPILAWCFGGLEEVFFVFLLTASALLILKWLEGNGSDRLAFLTGAVFALAAMTRFEGAIVWGITGFYLGVLWLLGHERDNVTFRRLCLLAAGFLLLFAPYMLWRVDYFGDWLPNTYYDKVYGIPGWILYRLGAVYLIQLCVLPPMLPLFAAGLLILTARRAFSKPLLYLIVITLTLALTTVRVGGDHMPYLRFLLPLIPMLALIVYHCNGALIAHHEKWFRDVTGALILLSLLQLGFIRMETDFSRYEFSGNAVMRYISAHWPEGSLVALNAAGAIPYYAPQYRYIDMLGLTDRHIARRVMDSEDLTRFAAVKPPGHFKGDGAYVLSRRPDYIIFGDAWGSREPDFLSDHELAASPEFQRDYERVEVVISPPAEMIPALKRQREREIEENPQRRPQLDEYNRALFIYYRRVAPHDGNSAAISDGLSLENGK